MNRQITDWEGAFRELVSKGFGRINGHIDWKWIADLNLDKEGPQLSTELMELMGRVIHEDGTVYNDHEEDDRTPL